MAVTQLYTALRGDVVTAARWNNEFGNVYNNGTDIPFPLARTVSFEGFVVTLDAVGVTTLTSPASAGLTLTVGAKTGTPSAIGALFGITSSTFTDTTTVSGGTASTWTGFSIATPSLTAANANVTTTLAATFYIEGPPTAGANETITNAYAGYLNGNVKTTGVVATIKGTDITSASSIAVVASFADVTGTTDISSISTVHPAGTRLYLLFTGTGLNLVHNATSFISPWGRDYRTVANELICFVSLGSGNYLFYSLNGPPERVGTSIEGNVASPPAGYLAEDGTAVSRTTYAGLFAEIGTTFGTGDGATTFNVPDTRGRVVIHVDGAANIITSSSTGGANADTLGGTGGAETHTLTIAEMGSHSHTIGVGAGGGGLEDGSGSTATHTSSSTGGGGAHSNTQPWIAKQKYIRF